MPTLAANLPGGLHAGVKAAPAKAKQHGKKRKDMLLQRGRFWQGIPYLCVCGLGMLVPTVLQGRLGSRVFNARGSLD